MGLATMSACSQYQDQQLGEMRVTTPPTNDRGSRPSLIPVSIARTAMADKSDVKTTTVMRAKTDTMTSPSEVSNRSSQKRVENRRCDFANIKSMFLESEKTDLRTDRDRDDARRKSSNDVQNLKAAFEKNRNNNNSNRCSTPTFQNAISTGENNVSSKISASSPNVGVQRHSYGTRASVGSQSFLRTPTPEKERNAGSIYRKSRNDVGKIKSTFEESEKVSDNDDEKNVKLNSKENEKSADIAINDTDNAIKVKSSSSKEKKEVSENAGKVEMKMTLEEKRKSFRIHNEAV